MEKSDFDFCGWATRTNVKCSDGRTIMSGAFDDMDGKKVPLVWNHDHENLRSVIGHSLLKVRPEGVYCYNKLNDSTDGNEARIRVNNGDLDSLSIYANQIKQIGTNVVHGNIREVSLVYAGANPGAFIDTVISHSDDCDEEAIIYNSEIIHSVKADAEMTASADIAHTDESSEDASSSEKSSNDSDDETVADILHGLSEKQMNAVYAFVGDLAKQYGIDLSDDSDDSDNSEEGDNVKHNVFDAESTTDNTELVHSALDNIIAEAKTGYSMKRIYNDYLANHTEEAPAIQHAATYGVEPVDTLFPEAKTINTAPEFVQRDMGWVSTLMGSVHHTPFSRIKSVFADITADEARARGYMKGKLKHDEVITLLKRTTTPQTVYKRQRMDRDDIVDITDFDVVAWLKAEMRMMLDEEIARAVLVGDGRSSASDDKISEEHIRPIWKDDDFYTIKASFTTASDASKDAEAFIDTAIRSRKDYKGSGNPILFTTEDMLTDMLLLKDQIGHYMYNSVTDLATRLRVRQIVTVEVMENQTRSVTSKTHTLKGIIVNPTDYNIGADRGGAINMFDDFDIDYNQQKYLIETRISGALIKPYAAIAIESATA